MSRGCTLKCHACGSGRSSRTTWRRGWCETSMGMRVACAAQPGCGTDNEGENMKTRIFLLSLAVASTGVLAGPEKVKYPADYLKGALYQTLDRPDVKQYRELYTQTEVVDAVRKGKPIPSGAVLTLVQWSVYEDA